MKEEHISNPKFGLHLGTKAPIINSIDIFDKNINTVEILQNHRGVLIDFFRGAW